MLTAKQNAITGFVLSLLLPCHAISGTPIATMTLQGGATTALSTQDSGTANYLVTLNPNVPNIGNPLSFSIKSGLPSGVTQVTSGSSQCPTSSTVCASNFSLTPGSSCCLELSFTGSNMPLGNNTVAPLISTTPATYKVQAPALNVIVDTADAILQISKPALGLSVRDTSTNAALTGQPRILTLTNNGPQTAHQVSYTITPVLPNDTTISPLTCGDIEPSATCVLTITPGATPSAAAGDSPNPSTITIKGSNTNAVTSEITVLAYGSIYQDGYVYSINDTTSSDVSVGGKVAALTNLSDPYKWTRTFAVTGADSITDGATNTSAIISNASCNGSTLNCAAYQCSSITTGNWYLPAICEMGPASNGSGSGCVSGYQNMFDNLSFLRASCLANQRFAGDYWSSTEYADSNLAQDSAWSQLFSSGGVQLADRKNLALGVRCSRALTL
jgi:hypothetical protein